MYCIRVMKFVVVINFNSNMLETIRTLCSRGDLNSGSLYTTAN
jgi:hypothetical protein